MINRLIEPSSGRIEVDGRNVLEQDPVLLRRSIGYVFQGIGLFPHMTVAENVGIVLRLLGHGKRQRRQRADDLLSLVELAPSQFADRLPAELSGGQQQRVGVARALAADPKYLLMDEPFGALDALTRLTLQQELLNLKKRLAKTIVFVTHDIAEALTLADRIAVMHGGSIEQIGPPSDLVERPASPFVRDLFAGPAANLRPATVTDTAGEV
jgi:osmoprotectant transport system ATP-binding protein